MKNLTNNVIIIELVYSIKKILLKNVSIQSRKSVKMARHIGPSCQWHITSDGLLWLTAELQDFFSRAEYKSRKDNIFTRLKSYPNSGCESPLPGQSSIHKGLELIKDKLEIDFTPAY